MASVHSAETITGKSERASPPDFDISTPPSFHFPHSEEKKKYHQLFVCYPFFSSYSTFPRILRTAVLGGQKHTQYTRTGSFPEKQKSMQNAGRMHRDLICITILAYVFFRRSLRRYVGTQQVPYALGCLYPERRNVGHACICRIIG